MLRNPPPAPSGDGLRDSIARYEQARVTDPRYGREYLFDVYEPLVDGRTFRFAAAEFSNGVFACYVPDEDNT